MKEQLRLIQLVITSPRVAFRSLPSERFYILAWIAPLYFGVARAFRPPNYERGIQSFGSPITLFLISLVLGIIVVPLGTWIVRQILKLFRKRLSVCKLMNIYGYALVPRLIVALVGYIILAASPSSLTQNQISPSMLILMILGLVGILYTLFLYIYGIVVCPSEAF